VGEQAHVTSEGDFRVWLFLKLNSVQRKGADAVWCGSLPLPHRHIATVAAVVRTKRVLWWCTVF